MWRCELLLKRMAVGLCVLLLSGCADFGRLLDGQDSKRVAVSWEALPQWDADEHAQALIVFLRGCPKMESLWEAVCASAAQLATQLTSESTTEPTAENDIESIFNIKPTPFNNARAKDFFERHFQAYQLIDENGNDNGLITGYYEPLLHGSRKPTPPYRYPIYARPSDLLSINVGDLYPDLKNKRLRGRVQGEQVIPYYSRAEIDGTQQPLAGQEILWVDNKNELFFLHIQGSGLVQLPDGEIVSVGYRDQNGHPYRSIGKILAQRGDMKLSDINLFSLHEWLENHPRRAEELLNQNPSYIFFTMREADALGPFGSLGVQLTPERSLAVDNSVIPRGAPVWLATVMPDDNITPLSQLMMAQDTGGAIKGAIRADFFWGRGKRAETMAGLMKTQGKIFVLLPRDAEI